MSNRIEAVLFAVLCPACGRDVPPLPPAPSRAVVERSAERVEISRGVPRTSAVRTVSPLERRSEPDVASDACEITVDAPSGITVELDVSVLSAPSEAFLRTGDARLMDEFETWSICLDRFDAERALLPEAAVVTQRDGRTRISFPVTDLPSDQRLWAVLTTLERRSPLDGAAGETLLRVFGPLERGGAPTHVELRVEPAARITGTVIGRRIEEWPGGDEDCESWSDEQWEAYERWETEQEPLDRFEYDLDLEGSRWIDAFLKCDDSEALADTRTYEGGRFVLAPSPSGAQRIAVMATTAGGATVHRVERTITARRGRVTDVGPWELQVGPGPMVLRCESEAGATLSGSFSLEFEGYPPAWIAARGGELAHAYGDWSSCRSVRFVPSDYHSFAPTEQRLPDGLSGDLTIVCRRREKQTSSVFLDGELPNGERLLGATCAWLKAPDEERWHAATLESLNAFCVRNWSSPTRTGQMDALLWNPERAASYQGSLTIPRSGPEELSVKVSLEEPRTRVFGDLRFWLAGEEVFDTLELRVEPPGLADDGFPAAWEDPAARCVEPGPFELRGLPPGVSFELVFVDTPDRVLRVERVQLARGETLDLGTLDFPAAR